MRNPLIERARNRLLQLLLPISALLVNSWAASPGMVERDPALPSWWLAVSKYDGGYGGEMKDTCTTSSLYTFLEWLGAC